MKTHIIFSILTALILTACASKEGRQVSSTQDTPEEQHEHSRYEGNAGRDVSRQ